MRRTLASGFVCVWALLSARLLASGPDLSELQATFDRIVHASKAQVGVGLIHVESGAQLAINGDAYFPMASVYKLPIAVELLAQVNQGALTLDRQVWIAPSDIRACCTLSRRHPRGGVSLTAGELLELMMVDSDNTAADAVLKLVGGPAVVQRRLRALGFTGINVNRYEGDINFQMTGVDNPPPQDLWTLELQRRLISEVPMRALVEARARYVADPRDSSTPNEMARFLARLQLNNLLPETPTRMLLELMARARTGPKRLKGRLPEDTVVAHKTGTTEVVINDVGLITLPDDSAIKGHLALAVFVTNGRVSAMQQTIAQLSGAAFQFFTGKPLPEPVKPVKPRRAPRRKRYASASGSRSTE
jgi:beta-lactamase class A